MSDEGESRVSRAVGKSEARYAAILESAVDGIVTIDDTGVIDSVNPSAERMFGYSAAELLGSNVKILMPAPYRDEHDGYLSNYRETGERKIIGIGREVLGRRKDGSTFPLYLAVSQVVFGGQVSFVGIVHDITDRKEVEEALRRERDFAESLVETARVIVLVLDVEGRVVRFNHYTEEVTGYTLEEVRGASWVETFLPECDHGRLQKVFAQTLRGTAADGISNPILTREGEERLIAWHNTTLCDAAGTVTGVLAVGQDITERMSLERQLHQAQKMEAIGRLGRWRSA